MVTSFLDHSGLAKACCINKEWNTAATPQLWNTFKTLPSLSKPTFTNPSFRRVLERNAHHIRHVLCRDDVSPTFQLLKHTLPNLRLTSITVLPKGAPVFRPCSAEYPPGSGEECHRLLRVISRSLPAVRTLDLFMGHDIDFDPRVAKDFFGNCLPEPEHLSVRINIYEDFSMERRRNCPVWTMLSYGKLEVVDDYFSPDMGGWSWLYDSPEILEVLQECYFKVTHFKSLGNPFAGSPINMKEDVAMEKYISTVTTHEEDGLQDMWVNIHLAKDLQSIPLASRALYRAAQKGSRKLHVCDGRKVASKDLQAVLHHGRWLRELGNDASLTLLALDAIKSECVQIGGIPIPDVQTNNMSGFMDPLKRPDPAVMKESRALQRKVYAQLGSLYSLTDLNLGYAPTSERELVFDTTGGHGPEYYDPLF
ncbi:hypothetical protein BGX29_001139 [Mortierella sp. GBA35]|nr:hypothetical protein BGX29_001139 [Mortierella sp. GBA35]